MPRAFAAGFIRSCCLVVLLVAAAAVAAAHADDEVFNLPQLKVTGLHKRAVRLSEYSIVMAKPGSAVPLLDPNEKPIGVTLSRSDFCAAALQGTVQVSGVRYSVAGKGIGSLADCESDCPRCAAFRLGENRFLPVTHPDGAAGKTYGLVAYRTVAVMDGTLPAGTVIFIPAARGLKLPNGRRHDGYFFVADVGALNSNQLDLYVGTRKLSWWIIGSGRTGRTLAAYVVTDRTIVARFKAAHTAAARALAAD
jgi:3D (Asp-Asp-Asp) domain-containing protein